MTDVKDNNSHFDENGMYVKEGPIPGSEMFIGGIVFGPPDVSGVPRVGGHTFSEWKKANLNLDFETRVMLDEKFIPFRALVKAKSEMFKKE